MEEIVWEILSIEGRERFQLDTLLTLLGSQTNTHKVLRLLFVLKTGLTCTSVGRVPRDISPTLEIGENKVSGTRTLFTDRPRLGPNSLFNEERSFETEVTVGKVFFPVGPSTLSSVRDLETFPPKLDTHVTLKVLLTYRKNNRP